LTEVTIKARDFSNCIGIKWRLVVDLTYPFIAYFAGNRFNAVIEKYFKDFDILVRINSSFSCIKIIFYSKFLFSGHLATLLYVDY